MPSRRVAIITAAVGFVVITGITGIAGYVAFRSDVPADGASIPDRARTEERPAPEFSLPSVRDEAATVALTDFRDRPLILNFWASWCVPCRKEMPALERVHRDLGDKVALVGIDHQDGRQSALDFLEEVGTSYPSGFDPQGKTAADYRLFGMPSTVFVSADGTILSIHTGELTERQLRDEIARLFGVGRSSSS